MSQTFTQSEFHESIHRALTVAFQAGRQAERDFFWRAVDLNATSNHLGEFIYLADLKDAIEELDAKRKEKNLP